jgi:hypothetical protein
MIDFDNWLGLGIAERTPENLIGRARILTTDRTSTLAAVESGAVTLRHAEVIADQCADVSGEVGVRFETAAIVMAEGMTPAKLKNKLSQVRERLQPDDSEARHQDALQDRQIVATMRNLMALAPSLVEEAARGRLETPFSISGPSRTGS